MMRTSREPARKRGGRSARHSQHIRRSRRRSGLRAIGRMPTRNRTRVEPVAARGVADSEPSPTTLQFLHRSEEHTSELQSLMRISYAVFCYTKKKIHQR